MEKVPWCEKHSEAKHRFYGYQEIPEIDDPYGPIDHWLCLSCYREMVREKKGTIPWCEKHDIPKTIPKKYFKMTPFVMEPVGWYTILECPLCLREKHRKP